MFCLHFVFGIVGVCVVVVVVVVVVGVVVVVVVVVVVIIIVVVDFCCCPLSLVVPSQWFIPTTLLLSFLAEATMDIPPKAVSPFPPPPRPILSEDGSVLPTPAAKAAAKAHPPPASDGPLCIICRAPMSSQEDCEAIFCGHAFHSICLREWRICARKGPLDCPFRCVPAPQMLGLSQSQLFLFRC